MEQTQSTMGLVKSNTALFTTLMEPKDTLDENYHVFKAQVGMTGNSGYHAVRSTTSTTK